MCSSPETFSTSRLLAAAARPVVAIAMPQALVLPRNCQALAYNSTVDDVPHPKLDHIEAARLVGCPQVVVLSQVLACDATLGYEDLYNVQVKKFNGVDIRNLRQLTELVLQCTDKYMRFDLDYHVSACRTSSQHLNWLSVAICRDATFAPTLLQQFVPFQRLVPWSWWTHGIS